MEVSRIIAEIDGQIAKLQQARALLAGTQTAPAVRIGRGRPKGSKNAGRPAKVKAATAVAPKRTLSPEGRKRIAEAMTKRWAEQRKTATKVAAKVASKTASK